jgi:ribonuclease HI
VLASAVRGIEALNQAASTLMTADSQYVSKGITQSIEGWKNSSEQPVKQ